MTTSILNILSALPKATNATGRVPMTPQQVIDTKAEIRRDNRGYNIQVNKFDIAKPYRVAINYNKAWDNYGDYASADVAAAIGTIVSAGYFGAQAKAGLFDASVVEASEDFAKFLADPRNTVIIARANGEMPQVHQSVAQERAES